MPVPATPFNRVSSIVSRWRAISPTGEDKGTVSLTNDSRRRYEARGWTFTRAGRSDWEGKDVQ